jgi:ribosomal protein L29
MANSRPRARRTAGSTRGPNGPKASTGPQAAQEQLKQAVQQLWLAGGIGAKAQRRILEVMGAAQETLQGRVGGAREQAQETWANLEALFQSRVERAMHQLGVPTAAEIRELSRRVAELNDTVIESRKPRRAAQQSAKRKVAPRRATKSAPRRAKAQRSRPAG